MTDKTRLFVRHLKSVGLVDAGANAGADILISKRADDDDRTLLQKTYDFLIGTDKRANVGNWFEAQIHRDFTVNADGYFAEGWLDRDERITLSNGIGAALDSFRGVIEENAPDLYDREPFTQPGTVSVSMSTDGTDSLKVGEAITSGGEGDIVTIKITNPLPPSVTISSLPDSIDHDSATEAENREEHRMADTPTLDDEIRSALPEEAVKYLDHVEARLAETEASKSIEDPAEEPDLSKREDLPEDVRKALADAESRIEAAEKRATDSEERIAKVEEERQLESAVKRAGSFNLFAKADEFGPILMKIEGALDDDEFEKLSEWLTAAQAKIESSDLFAELGKDASKSDVETSIEDRARKLAETENITYEVAYKRVLDGDKELRKRLYEETVLGGNR